MRRWHMLEGKREAVKAVTLGLMSAGIVLHVKSREKSTALKD
jgi:hypothetical protein